MSDRDARLAKIEGLIGNFPDFPKAGVVFRDVFPVMRHPSAFNDLIDLLTEHIQANHAAVDVVVGLDARGFIFGPMVAQKLGVAFVPIRKKGKLPGETVSVSYELEYGTDQFEVQRAAITPGQKVVIVDDLLATGGTMSAAYKLMQALQAVVLECLVVIELSDLGGRAKVPAKTHALFAMADN